MSKSPTSRFAVPIPAEPLRVRRAVDADLSALIALENDSFSSDQLSPRQWAQHLGSDTARVLVALLERKLIGAAVLFFRRGSDIARLYSLAIAAHSRGIGIGDTLLDAAEKAAQRQSCTRLRLEVRRDNGAARRLYGRRGYLLIGERRAYYEDGEDAVRYEKTLGDQRIR